MNNVHSIENQNQGQDTDEELEVTDDLSFEAACSLVKQSFKIFYCSSLKVALDISKAFDMFWHAWSSSQT